MAIFLGCIVYLPEALKVGINSSNMKNMVNFTNFGAYILGRKTMHSRKLVANIKVALNAFSENF